MATAARGKNARPLDLTMTISDRLPMFPGSPPPQFIGWSDLERDGYNLELVFASTHSGTHMDAPYHFAKGGKRMDQVSPERMVGRATLIRVGTESAPAGRNRMITRDDILKFERSRQGHAIPPGEPVIFYTGWQKSHLARGDYFLANPGLDGSAARYLASRGASLVGTDSPSIDAGRDSSFTAHKILAKAGIPIVENLANLEKIRSATFEIVVLPLKLKGASGSPVRALALSR